VKLQIALYVTTYVMNTYQKNYKVQKRIVTRKNGEKVLLRSMETSDKSKLAEFLSKLSDKTRYFYQLDDYGDKSAEHLCSSLSNPEKKHFIIENNAKDIIALVKFSLDLPEKDRVRFAAYGIELKPGETSRCGTCVADAYQSSGIGSITLEQVINSSIELNQSIVMLSGGTVTENKKAVNTVQKFSFEIVGKYIDSYAQERLDMLYIIKE